MINKLCVAELRVLKELRKELRTKPVPSWALNRVKDGLSTECYTENFLRLRIKGFKR